jgi:membrane associated rhomboid family serine protease
MFWIVQQWLDSQGFKGDQGGIAYFAHIGGFVFGVLTGFFLKRGKPLNYID